MNLSLCKEKEKARQMEPGRLMQEHAGRPCLIPLRPPQHLPCTMLYAEWVPGQCVCTE